MRITQSISLSNIQTLLSKARPEALSETCRLVFTDRAACSLIGVGLIQKSSNFGGDQETANELLVELNGIEPLTSCLQSTRSPN